MCHVRLWQKSLSDLKNITSQNKSWQASPTFSCDITVKIKKHTFREIKLSSNGMKLNIEMNLKKENKLKLF